MTLVLTLLSIIVAGLAAAVAAGRIGGGMPAPETTLPPLGLPDGELRAQDIAQLRLSAGLRGYRMDQVDAVLARLMQELQRQEAEIEELRAQRGASRYDTGEVDQAHFANLGQHEPEASLLTNGLPADMVAARLAERGYHRDFAAQAHQGGPHEDLNWPDNELPATAPRYRDDVVEG